MEEIISFTNEMFSNIFIEKFDKIGIGDLVEIHLPKIMADIFKFENRIFYAMVLNKQKNDDLNPTYKDYEIELLIKQRKYGFKFTEKYWSWEEHKNQTILINIKLIKK